MATVCGVLVLLCFLSLSLACDPACDGLHQCINGVCECANGKSGTNCDVNRHVLMRVASHAQSAGPVTSMWKDNTFTPDIGTSLGPAYFSLSGSDKERLKSPLVECSWSHVKNVRYSYFSGGEEKAYFSSKGAGTDKNSWFGSAYAYDSSFTDLVTSDTFNYFSVDGDGQHYRRFYVNRNYGGCPSDAGWFVLLDTDHQRACTEWETDDPSTLPALMYSPQTTHSVSTGWSLAEVMQVTADFGDAFGGSCVSSCVGLDNGHYHSCMGCNVYVSCVSQTLVYARCPDGTSFDAVEGTCVETSTTCTGGNAPEQCQPDIVCAANRMYVNGVCECNSGKSGTNCDMDRHVLMRVAAGTPDAGTVTAMWTENTLTPAIDVSLGPEYFSLSVDDKERYKSPLVECSWNHVKNVRYSYFSGGNEVAYFSSKGEGTDKISWFSKTYAYDSSYYDLLTETETNFFSIEGDSGHTRHFYVNRNYGGCGVDSGWLVLLDTDHSQYCVEWETGDQSLLPSLMYCPSSTHCLASGWSLAEVMEVTADLGDAFGGSCVSSCVGLADGNYQSCLGCNVYVSCASDTLTYGVCRDGTSFDSGEGSCVASSSTCTGDNVAEACRPDGCDPNPCKNNGQCSMGTTGWVCDCSTDTSGYGGHTCEVMASYCTAHSDDNVCNNGTCSDVGSDDYSCTCDPGYAGDNCETLASYCTAFAESTPCKNGGECNDLSEGKFECDCTAEYIGDTCETPTFCKANENNASVCINGGQCVDEENGVDHHCECAAGFTGENCETVGSYCTAFAESTPCKNRGECSDLSGGQYECDCPADYIGENCETPTFCKANENNASVCINGGQCVDEVDGIDHHCECAAGYTGENCETLASYCTAFAESTPCKNGGECNDLSGGRFECDCTADYSGDTCETPTYCKAHENNVAVCINGGQCVDEADRINHHCVCAEGYKGDNCETETYCKANENDPTVCSNGGTCVDHENRVNHTCDCASGYTGDNCDDETFCTANPGHCRNGGTCADIEVDFDQCTCAAGYLGANCEFQNQCVPVNPCKNGGACSPSDDGSAECSCADGWLGDTCGVEDPCASGPCQNGGTCTPVPHDDGTVSANCSCAKHFDGTHCENGPCQRGEYIAQCADTTCVNKEDGTCEVETQLVQIEDNGSPHVGAGWVAVLLSLALVFHLLE